MNLKKYSWLAILPMVFTACQDDMLVETSSRGITTLTASMGDKATGSRAQIVLNGSNKTKEIFHWNEGDAFTVFQLMTEDGTGLSSHRFSIADTYSDDEPTASADFSTLDEGLSTGRNFVAFYPTPVMDENSTQYFHLTLDGSLPDNSNESWVEYFKNNMFMTTTGTVSETTGVTGLTFKHLCGIIRISYFNDSPAERTISRIGVDGSFGNSYGYQLGGDCSIWESMGTTDLGISFEKGATVAAGETANFYILFMDSREPEEAKLPLSVVRVDFEDGTAMGTPVYSKTLPLFQVGKSYWLNVTDNGERLLWSKDIVEDDGGDTNPNEAFVSDFVGLQTALENGVQNIWFEGDIALEAPLTITNVTNFYMDGNTLSLASNYDKGTSDAVIDVNTRLYVKYGTLEGKDGDKLHDYYFKLSGEQANLSFRGVDLNTGNSITNAIFMDDDNLELRSQSLSETEAKESSITTSGNAIHWVAKKSAPILWSYLNGTINGNVYIESTFDQLNTRLIFESGVINGNLDTNLMDGIVVSESVLKTDKVTIGTGYTGWEAAGRYVKNQNYTIFELKDLKTAFETPQEADEMTIIYFENDIVLTEPLTSEKPIHIMLNNRTLSLSNSFNWGAVEAAITVTNGSLNIDEGTIQGSSTVADGKYLIKYSGDDFGLHGVTLDGRGVEHALLLQNARVDINNATINVNKGGFAANVFAETSFSQLIFGGTSVNGNVGFTANYPAVEPDPNVVAVAMNSTVNGDLKVTGTYKDDLIVDIYESTVDGAGWNDAAIALMQKEFSEHGDVYVEKLELVDNQTIVFEVGKTNEGNVHLDIPNLQGTGTIKLVNKESSLVTVHLYVEDFLSSSVNFAFEGNFQKDIFVKTDRVKEFVEMAEGSDRIFIGLPGNVSLTQQIVVNSGLQFVDGTENSAPQGEIMIEMNGYTLSNKMDNPAFVIQGGFLTFEGGGREGYNVGTIASATEFVQIGAEANESNNLISLRIPENVTCNIESESWINVDAIEPNLTAHKDVTIYILKEMTDEEKQAKVKVAEGYKGTITIK